MEALTLEQLDELEHSLKSGAGWSVWFTQESMCALIAMARASLADREDTERWRWAVAHQDAMACLMTFYPENDTQDGLTAAVDAARAQPPKD